LDAANHRVHELEKFGGARGRRQALGFIANSANPATTLFMVHPTLVETLAAYDPMIA
jgi:hypothetical protein